MWLFSRGRAYGKIQIQTCSHLENASSRPSSISCQTQHTYVLVNGKNAQYVLIAESKAYWSITQVNLTAPSSLQLWDHLIRPVLFNGLLSNSAATVCSLNTAGTGHHWAPLWSLFLLAFWTSSLIKFMQLKPTDQPDSCLTHTVLLFSVVWLCTMKGWDAVCNFPEWTSATLAPSAKSRRFPVATSSVRQIYTCTQW